MRRGDTHAKQFREKEILIEGTRVILFYSASLFKVIVSGPSDMDPVERISSESSL
jgi:hypothetical protein